MYSAKSFKKPYVHKNENCNLDLIKITKNKRFRYFGKKVK